MKFLVTQAQLQEIVEKAEEIKEANVQAFLSASQLYVTISKLGTSTLTFSIDETTTPWTVALIKQDIAFFHKPYIAQFKAAIGNLVTQCGGTVEDLN